MIVLFHTFCVFMGSFGQGYEPGQIFESFTRKKLRVYMFKSFVYLWDISEN